MPLRVPVKIKALFDGKIETELGIGVQDYRPYPDTFVGIDPLNCPRILLGLIIFCAQPSFNLVMNIRDTPYYFPFKGLFSS